MLGLLEKDYRLVLRRKKALLLFGVLAIVVGILTSGTILTGYMSLLAAIFTIDTFSSDDMDNGMPFLMTMPIDRDAYIIEKFIFVLLGGIVGWGLAYAFNMLLGIFGMGTALVGYELVAAMVFLPAYMIVISIMIPVQLRFGGEKSRLVLIVVAAVVLSLCLLAAKNLTFQVAIEGAAIDAEALAPLMVTSMISSLSVICMLISFLLSRRIMRSKEF